MWRISLFVFCCNSDNSFQWLNATTITKMDSQNEFYRYTRSTRSTRCLRTKGNQNWFNRIHRFHSFAIYFYFFLLNVEQHQQPKKKNDYYFIFFLFVAKWNTIERDKWMRTSCIVSCEYLNPNLMGQTINHKVNTQISHSKMMQNNIIK